MVVLINGAFGIGKTTVAAELADRLPGSIVFNPEFVGILLQRSGRLLGMSVEDFQDLKVWRRLVVLLIRILRVPWRYVLVPMAFSNLRYLQEIRSGVGRFEPQVLHFCLVAPESVVAERLRSRRHTCSPRDHSWQHRRAAECCSAHLDPAFGAHVSTNHRTSEEVAEEILRATKERTGAA